MTTNRENLNRILWVALMSFNFKNLSIAQEHNSPQPFECWSAAGSTGIADKKSAHELVLGAANPLSTVGAAGNPSTKDTTYGDVSARINPSDLPGKHTLSYPVSPFRCSPNAKLTFSIHYKLSDAAKDKVTAYLKECNKQDNSVKIVAQIEGNVFVKGKYIVSTSSVAALDFKNNIYSVEVILESTIRQPPVQPPFFLTIDDGPAIGRVEICSGGG